MTAAAILLDGEAFLLVGGVILLLAIMVFFAAGKEKKRRRGLKLWAASQGYECDDKDDDASFAPYRYFGFLGVGGERKASFKVKGEFQGLPFVLFDFQYNVSNGETDVTMEFTACIIETAIAFPTELRLRPRTALDRIKATLGFGDISFESAEFSKRFFVTSEDRKFAFDIIHQGMMSYLLEHRKTFLEFEEQALFTCIDNKKKLNAAGYQRLLQHARMIVELIPEHFVHSQKGES